MIFSLFAFSLSRRRSAIIAFAAIFADAIDALTPPCRQPRASAMMIFRCLVYCLSPLRFYAIRHYAITLPHYCSIRDDTIR
jgi:hypothetical protein